MTTKLNMATRRPEKTARYVMDELDANEDKQISLEEFQQNIVYTVLDYTEEWGIYLNFSSISVNFYDFGQIVTPMIQAYDIIGVLFR